ncbi:MAG: single-stranded DNA-binding protein [Proteobacteria bacterium]|nr:single-stranded DNA-binding protein [Desulfobacula sp.]MBU4130293.1 single-stranded DNA-binding protein [Pseudomonadota bacterium]
MAGINKAIILGHLGQNPEISYTQSGLAVCKFSLATSKKMKNGQEVTQWHRCTAFDKAGELISKYVSKGNMLYIEGEITYSQYEKDGVTKYSTDIIVREFNFIGSGGGREDGNQNTQQGGGYQGNQGGGYQSGKAPSQGNKGPNSNNYQGRTSPGMTGGQDSIPDDDIPF